MTKLCQVILIVALTITITNGVGGNPVVEDNNFRFAQPEKDTFPSTNFVPSNLKIAEGVYDKLLDHLADELSVVSAQENVNIKADGYFPKDVESDELDALEFVQEYDVDEDEDDDDDVDADKKFIKNLPDVSISTGFGKRQFTFAKVLAISKNGTKTFSKFRQSIKIGGDATTSVTGNFNTSLDVTTSASAKFDTNITYSSKGHSQKAVASGTVNLSASSKSKIVKRRLFQQASLESSTTVQIPALNGQSVHVNSSVRSGSETLKIPFRSFFTLFKVGINTTIDNGLKTKAILGGQVVSRVAFANKTVSLTKSCVKAYVKSKSTPPTIKNDEIVDDENNTAASTNLFQISLIKSKIHTWTKVVSQNKTQVVIDVISCTKTRAYGKTIQKGVSVIFSGAGQVSWEKSRITIGANRLQYVSPHEYGVHFIQKQLESSSLIQLDTLGSLTSK